MNTTELKAVPPVFFVEDLTPNVIDDIKDASATYCCDYEYTAAFDDLILEDAETIERCIAGTINPRYFAERLRDRLLGRWSSSRSLWEERMPAVGDALGNIRVTVAAIPRDMRLEDADYAMRGRAIDAFTYLIDKCPGVGPTIASKLLAPLRPALFPIWDNPIARSYGFAINAAGYRQYLIAAQAIIGKVRSLWKRATPLEEYLKPEGRKWTAPLAKVFDEWNWIRITKGQAYVRSA